MDFSLALYLIFPVALIVGGLLLVGVIRATVDHAPPLTRLEGELARLEERYVVDGVRLGLGPAGYLRETRSAGNYARDGSGGSLADQLDALVGCHVTTEIGPVHDGSADVYTLNGLGWRPHDDSPPPWAGTSARDRQPPGRGGAR